MKYAPLSHPFFILCCGLFLAHQTTQKWLGWSLTWADAYLDPLLAMPILLGFFLAERRWLFGEGAGYTLSAWEVAALTAALAVIFELLFPWLSTKFTPDWRDVAAYAAGGLAFYFILNRA
jgi:hypothetical protein